MPTAGPTAVVDRLRSTALDLVSLVTGADAAPLRAVPAPGEWSAATVVAHLADAEQVYGVRARMMLTADRPWLTSFDEKAWVARFFPLERDVRESLQRWRSLRDANVRVFDSLTEEEWAREGVLDQQGTVTVAGLAGLIVSHDRAHLDQIRRALSGAR